MASTGQSEDNMNTLQEFTGVSRAHASILLEKYVTVEQAMNQYFEDPVGSVKQQAPPNQWEPADNIPYADDMTELPTMSRPPSRVDHRAQDMAGPNLPAAVIPSAEEMQDADLQRAIAMSKQDISGQETGVVGSGQQFGPANRPYYDMSQWTMTTISSSREIVDHPPPAKRQRISGQPAFLRGSIETGYLAPLLNIYHSIPLAREAFMSSSMRVLAYGNDPQWWSGTSDENTKSISIEASDRGIQDRHNFLAELQCLMAFLDSTDRAYGSVDALYDLRAMKTHHSETQLSRLLETWVEAAMLQTRDSQLTQIFTSTAMKAQELDEPIQKDLVCLEPTVRRFEGQTLVNLLDSTIWDDDANKIDDIWIAQCAEVFTMRLYDPNNEAKGLGLEIPAMWYPDRYMYEHRDTTRQWRKEMLALRQEINQCSAAQRRCEAAHGPGKRVIKIREVLEAASKLATDVDTVEPLPESSTSDKAQETAADSELADVHSVRLQLQAIVQRIDEKVAVLEARKQDLYKQIRTIAAQLTEPGDDPTLSPRHRYYLQGVSTKPNTTYIRRREPEHDDEGSPMEQDTETLFQWWRVVWGTEDIPQAANGMATENQLSSTQSEKSHTVQPSDTQQAYSVQRVTEDDVLQAAKTEHNSIVLVYASENAMNFTPSTPNPALRKFVEQDNRAFQDEINRQNGGILRRLSQDTNTTIMEDMPFDNRSVTPSDLREMTPMSTTSPQRGEDGQPSPKRAKGDEAYHVYRESDTDDEPPSYEEGDIQPQMQEKKVNKIGLLADQMLERYGNDNPDKAGEDGPVHIEHAKDPLR